VSFQQQEKNTDCVEQYKQVNNNNRARNNNNNNNNDSILWIDFFLQANRRFRPWILELPYRTVRKHRGMNGV